MPHGDHLCCPRGGWRARDDAIAAVEELAAYGNCFTNIENRLGSVETRLSNVENRLDHIESRLGVVETNVATLAGKITVLTWAVGINAAATIAILGVLLRGYASVP